MSWILLYGSELLGEYETETEAMRAASNLGLIVPAADDEGGYPFGVLAPRYMIILKGETDGKR